MLNKALEGQNVTISVLGGSGMPFFFASFHTFQTQHTIDHAVSACHGAGDDHISPTCYPSRFFHWWNTVFPHPATELTNGALRRTNWGYFGYCNSHHLPDQTDLVIIELDTEDEPCVSLFLSFLFRLFCTTRFLFASVRYRSVATALRPFYTRRPIVTPQMTDFTTQTTVDAHEAHPARLLIYPLPWLHHGFTLFTSSIQP